MGENCEKNTLSNFSISARTIYSYDPYTITNEYIKQIIGECHTILINDEKIRLNLDADIIVQDNTIHYNTSSLGPTINFASCQGGHDYVVEAVEIKGFVLPPVTFNIVDGLIVLNIDVYKNGITHSYLDFNVIEPVCDCFEYIEFNGDLTPILYYPLTNASADYKPLKSMIEFEERLGTFTKTLNKYGVSKDMIMSYMTKPKRTKKQIDVCAKRFYYFTNENEYNAKRHLIKLIKLVQSDISNVKSARK